MDENMKNDPHLNMCNEDYYDKAEQDFKDVQDIKYQEELREEIERENFKYFYEADTDNDIPWRLLWSDYFKDGQHNLGLQPL